MRASYANYAEQLAFGDGGAREPDPVRLPGLRLERPQQRPLRAAGRGQPDDFQYNFNIDPADAGRGGVHGQQDRPQLQAEARPRGHPRYRPRARPELRGRRRLHLAEGDELELPAAPGRHLQRRSDLRFLPDHRARDYTQKRPSRANGFTVLHLLAQRRAGRGGRRRTAPHEPPRLPHDLQRAPSCRSSSACRTSGWAAWPSPSTTGPSTGKGALRRLPEHVRRRHTCGQPRAKSAIRRSRAARSPRFPAARARPASTPASSGRSMPTPSCSFPGARSSPARCSAGRAAPTRSASTSARAATARCARWPLPRSTPSAIDDLWNLDLRLAKTIKLGGSGLTLAAEWFNVFNNGIVLSRSRFANARRFRQPVPGRGSGEGLGRIEEIIAPRIFRFGARFTSRRRLVPRTAPGPSPRGRFVLHNRYNAPLMLASPAARSRPRRRPPTSSWSPSTPCAPTAWARTATRARARPCWTAWRGRASWSRTPSCTCRRPGPRTPRSSPGGLPYEHGLRDNSLGAARRADARPWPRCCKGQRLRHGRVHRRLPGLAPFRPRPRVRRLRRPLRRRARAPPRATRAPSAAAAEVVDAALTWLARPRTRALLPVGPPLRPARPLRGAGTFRRAVRGAALRRRGGLRGRAGRPAARAAARARARCDRTLVVVTSDHGEGLGDHGEDEHLLFVYDSTLRVPAAHAPSREAARGGACAGQFRSVDLMPTMLDLLGLPASPASGASRAAQSRRAACSRPTSRTRRASTGACTSAGRPCARCARRAGNTSTRRARSSTAWPTIARETREPHGRPRAGRRARCGSSSAPSTRGVPKPPPIAVDSGAAERLAALGYVGGGFFQGPPSGADPKDRLAGVPGPPARVPGGARASTARATSTAPSASSPGSRSRAAKVARWSSGARSTSSTTSAAASWKGGAFADAVEHLARASALAPESVPAYVFLAQAQPARDGPAKRGGRARPRAWRRARPTTRSCCRPRGGLLLRAEPPPKRAPLSRRARTLDPATLSRAWTSPPSTVAGQLDAARVEAEEAVRRHPRVPRGARGPRAW